MVKESVTKSAEIEISINVVLDEATQNNPFMIEITSDVDRWNILKADARITVLNKIVKRTILYPIDKVTNIDTAPNQDGLYMTFVVSIEFSETGEYNRIGLNSIRHNISGIETVELCENMLAGDVDSIEKVAEIFATAKYSKELKAYYDANSLPVSSEVFDQYKNTSQPVYFVIYLDTYRTAILKYYIKNTDNLNTFFASMKLALAKYLDKIGITKVSFMYYSPQAKPYTLHRNITIGLEAHDTIKNIMTRQNGLSFYVRLNMFYLTHTKDKRTTTKYLEESSFNTNYGLMYFKSLLDMLDTEQYPIERNFQLDICLAKAAELTPPNDLVKLYRKK